MFHQPTSVHRIFPYLLIRAAAHTLALMRHHGESGFQACNRPMKNPVRRSAYPVADVTGVQCNLNT